MKNLIRTNCLLSICVLALVVMMVLPSISMAQTKKPWAKYSNGTLTFSYGAKPAGANVYEVPLDAKETHDLPWVYYENGINKEIKKVIFTASFKQVTNITSTRQWFSSLNNLESIIGLENLNTSKVTDMCGMFEHCNSLKSLNLSRFNTSKVTKMNEMFRGCSALISLNLSSFNTVNVTNMDRMFSGCESLKSLNLSSFNTSNVRYMDSMFSSCMSLVSINLSKFNTSNVRYMGSMFSACVSLTSLDLSRFNTSNVVEMKSMFQDCEKIKSLDLSNFDTRKVAGERNGYNGGMADMFGNCKSLKTINLSSFNTANVGDMGGMFENCSSLITLDISNFNTDKVYSMVSMFQGCSSLKTLIVPANSWNMERVRKNGDYTSTKYMFDGCNATVTAKNGSVVSKSDTGPDPNSMSWPSPDFSRNYNGNKWGKKYSKYVTWRSNNKSMQIDKYAFSDGTEYYEVISRPSALSENTIGKYKTYKDAEAAAYYYSEYGARRTKGRL